MPARLRRVIYNARMPDSVRSIIRIDGLPGGDADAAAADLYQTLLGIKAADSITRVRQNPQHQDFGASLAVVLAAPAAVAIAKGLADWLRLWQKAEVVIETPNGKVVVRGGPAHKIDIQRLAETLRGENKPDEPRP